MTLFSRIQDILLANAHHTIDAAEDPEKMIKQVIREMDDNIREARAAVVGAVTSEKQLAAQLDRQRASSSNLARKAESAVAAGQEELAKALLARKVDNDRIAADLENSWKSAKNTCENLKTRLDELIARRAEAWRQREGLFARQRAARARKKLGYSLAAFETPESADEKFMRMQERVSEMEAESLAVCEVLGEPTGPEAAAGELETKVQVDLELQAIRERLRVRSTSGDRERGLEDSH